MSEIIEQRKKQLKMEIAQARQILFDNIENTDLTDYAQHAINPLPAMIKTTISNPMEVLGIADMMSRQFLDEENLFRKILKYLNMAKKGLSKMNIA